MQVSYSVGDKVAVRNLLKLKPDKYGETHVPVVPGACRKVTVSRGMLVFSERTVTIAEVSICNSTADDGEDEDFAIYKILEDRGLFCWTESLLGKVVTD